MLKLRVILTYLLSLFVSGLVCLFFIWTCLERMSYANKISEEITKVQNYLIQSGYDLSYDELRFNKYSLSKLLSIKNLKIYRNDKNGYFEWSIPELSVNPDLFLLGKLHFKLSSNQTIQKDAEKFYLFAPHLDISMNFNKSHSLDKLSIDARDVSVQNLLNIGSLQFNAKSVSGNSNDSLTPSFENIFEVKEVEFHANAPIPISKNLDRFYVNADIRGVIKEEDSYLKSIISWLNMGGMVDIKNIVLNWSPITMVGRGDLYFNEMLEPTLHLSTSSKGLLETIDAFETKEILDSKGCFVLKILLNNKAFQLNPEDEHKTVTTPIDYRNAVLSIDNVSIKRFK